MIRSHCDKRDNRPTTAPHAGNSAKTIISLKPKAEDERTYPVPIPRQPLLHVADISLRSQLDGVLTENEIDNLEKDLNLPSLAESNAAKHRAANMVAASGSTWARYHFPQARVSSYGRLRTVGPDLKIQHYDVMVDWDYDHVNLSTDYGVWSPDFCRAFFSYQTSSPKIPSTPEKPGGPNVGFMRGIHNVTRSAGPRRIVNKSETAAPDRAQIWSHWAPAPLHRMDTLEMLMWVRQLKPRTVNDMKPLLLLCQCLLGDVLHNKIEIHMKRLQEQEKINQRVIDTIKESNSGRVGKLEEEIERLTDEIKLLKSQRVSSNVNIAHSHIQLMMQQKRGSVVEAEAEKDKEDKSALMTQVEVKEDECNKLREQMEKLKEALGERDAQLKKRADAANAMKLQMQDMMKRNSDLEKKCEALEKNFAEQLKGRELGEEVAGLEGEELTECMENLSPEDAAAALQFVVKQTPAEALRIFEAMGGQEALRMFEAMDPSSVRISSSMSTPKRNPSAVLYGLACCCSWLLTSDGLLEGKGVGLSGRLR